MFTLEELNLAWERLKLDRRKRAFVHYPHLIAWIERDRQSWLRYILDRVGRDYEPSTCPTCSIPKGKGLIRPGVVLSIEDEVVYNALVGKLHPRIWETIGISQGVTDMAYQLCDPARGAEWIRASLEVWTAFRDRSLARLDGGAQFVLFADITAFYENIDLGRLSSDLNQLHVEASVVTLLMNCLKRWAPPTDRGLPQGYSASDVLAKLYMASVDANIANQSYQHLRYVDDFRLFCRSKIEAKKALLLLIELLRDRGLQVQSAKTDIVRAEEARRKIDGIRPVIGAVQNALRDEIHRTTGELGEYATVEEIENYLREHPEDLSREILERTFRDSFAPTRGSFNKALFHYSRLRKPHTLVWG